ncbi:hypothetical protein [Actinomadura madurae]|uniref:hypothetical protein n=1 Tax=Actinomadura madurae TaxID=1993 RepID=UPI0020D213EC|nr:hypothetical protein [Actinomadura madurae]MCQ0015449.1 hypothetical protein [Actinomadura madurae]
MDQRTDGEDSGVQRPGRIHRRGRAHHRARRAAASRSRATAAAGLFANRLGELEELEALAETPGLVVVTGPGGVGKTTLALHWLHRIKDGYEGQLFVDLRGFSGTEPLPPDEPLERFLRALGAGPESIPPGADEQSALFRSMTTGRRLVVMLDNAVSAAQVRPLLPGAGASLVVVTSRHRLTGLVVNGARFLDVDPLGEPGGAGAAGAPDRGGPDPGGARARPVPGRAVRDAPARALRVRRPPRRPAALADRPRGRRARRRGAPARRAAQRRGRHLGERRLQHVLPGPRRGAREGLPAARRPSGARPRRRRRRGPHRDGRGGRRRPAARPRRRQPAARRPRRPVRLPRPGPPARAGPVPRTGLGAGGGVRPARRAGT